MLVMHATLPSDTPASNTHNLWCWGSRLLSYSIRPNKSAILVRDASWWGSIGDGWLYIVFPRYTLPRKPTAVSFSLHIRLLPGRVSWLPIDNTHSHLCIHPTHGLLTLQIAPIIASSSSHSPTTCLPYLHCNPVSVVSSCWIACTRSRMSASLEPIGYHSAAVVSSWPQNFLHFRSYSSGPSRSSSYVAPWWTTPDRHHHLPPFSGRRDPLASPVSGIGWFIFQRKTKCSIYRLPIQLSPSPSLVLLNISLTLLPYRQRIRRFTLLEHTFQPPLGLSASCVYSILKRHCCEFGRVVPVFST